MSNKKRKLSENSEEESDISEENINVELIKKVAGYEPEILVYEDIPIPSCESFLATGDKKYTIFALVLKINTRICLSNVPDDILTFLHNLYFLIYNQKEACLNTLLDITHTLNISVMDTNDIITDDVIENVCNKKDFTKSSDRFPEIYQTILNVLKKLNSIHLPHSVRFTGFDTPFKSSSFDTKAVRVYFEPLIAPFQIEKVQMNAGTKQSKTFTTRKLKSHKFIEELAKYIEHNGDSITDVVWKDIDIGITQKADEDCEIVVYPQIAQFDTIKSENYALLQDIIIYKHNKKTDKPTDSLVKKLNIRGYTRKVVTFNYDAKLAEEYKEFLSARSFDK